MIEFMEKVQTSIDGIRATVVGQLRVYSDEQLIQLFADINDIYVIERIVELGDKYRNEWADKKIAEENLK